MSNLPDEFNPAQWAAVQGVRRVGLRGIMEWSDRAGLALLAGWLDSCCWCFRISLAWA